MRKAFSRSRPLFALLAFAAGAALASAVPVRTEAASCPKIISTDYYFDAAKTQFAGHCVRMCNLQTTCYGTVTPYTIVETEPCGCF